ncbi:hypothetical protein KO507_05255 [Gilvimarinus agarilyticus]|uniref:hypothetical protein n=1 Tax=Gilvimarinus sp. 2_MG-2023 TaxID=3062666 RepID=UPI001C09B94B|nr:hypothetical protein [Gilvimarinus sp. 2_MG-2023]MBU2885167.1 hypothetical protein [Gilvimarinus agarilyticus]MDO6570066.1 hypothetical protein [Gilvimarinus sp. 2_MG-2023]
MLKKNDLLGLAKEIAPSGFEGGMSKEETDKHLAWRYNGSCARVILSLLDPMHQLSKVSDAYASIFAGGRVFLADLPSGSGAAIVSILCTLYELRKSDVLPRDVLTIQIIAGEISKAARDYLAEQLTDLTPIIGSQAIFIEFEIVEWNALCKISTVDLMRKSTLLSQNSTAKLLVVSNFSGFLENSGKWSKARPQFDDIFLYSRDSLSTAIWIEPQRNTVASFFERAIKWFDRLFGSSLGSKSDPEDVNSYAKTSVDCKQPIKEGCFPVRLTVVRFDLRLEERK